MEINNRERIEKTTIMQACMKFACKMFKSQEANIEIKPFRFEDEFIQVVDMAKKNERTLTNGNG